MYSTLRTSTAAIALIAAIQSYDAFEAEAQDACREGTDSGSLECGDNAEANGFFATAIGNGAEANNDATAVGAGARASGSSSLALGAFAVADGFLTEATTRPQGPDHRSARPNEATLMRGSGSSLNR